MLRYLFITNFFIIFISCSTTFNIENRDSNKNYKIGDIIYLKSNLKKGDQYSVSFKYNGLEEPVLFHYFENISKFNYSVILKDRDEIILEKTFSITPKDILPSYYIPDDSDLVFNYQNSLDPSIFNIEKSGSFYYFRSKGKSYYLSEKDRSSKCNINNYEIYGSKNLCTLNYQKGKFLNLIDEFDIFYKNNFYQVISNGKKKLTLFSTSNKKYYADLKNRLKVFISSKIEILIYEYKPIFFNFISKFLSIDLPISNIEHYFLAIYSYKKRKNKDFIDQYLLILTFENIETIEKLKKSFLNYTPLLIHNYQGYVSKDESRYIFFKNRRVIISSHINILDLINKIKKIPFPNLKPKKIPYGYIFLKDITNFKLFKKPFSIFEILNIKKSVELYFINYKK